MAGRFIEWSGQTECRMGMDKQPTNRSINDQQCKPWINGRTVGMIGAILFALFLSFKTSGQTDSYIQLNNEIQFARPFNERWSGEMWLGNTFSSTPNESTILETFIQGYATAWVNYFLPPKWKFSAALSYYYNKDVPDIGQYLCPEWRLSLQPTYYFHKVNYILFTRSRVELRYMWNSDSVFQLKFRFRQMLKFVKPINGKTLRQGIFYFLTSEELFFKPDAKSTGVTFFDRNRFELGFGYLFTDDLQLELVYANEFLPRDEKNEMYNVVTFTLTFNNFLTNLAKSMKPKPKTEEQTE
jgi:hypothetical protein